METEKNFARRILSIVVCYDLLLLSCSGTPTFSHLIQLMFKLLYKFQVRGNF